MGPIAFTYFARDPLRSYFDECQKNGIKMGVTLILHVTHCIHTSMNVRKMKFISYIYIILETISINQCHLKVQMTKVYISVSSLQL